jgi:predicted secreted hydrolase
MAGVGGSDGLDATARNFGISLLLTDTRAAPVLHNTIGWIDFGDGGSSYYYSRPRMTATGTLTVNGQSSEVSGEAWFDHQWGDFIAVGGGGWDWFAVNLDDGTDLTISRVRAADGTYPLIYGTLAGADGSVTLLTRDQLTLSSQSTWTGPRTGAEYPMEWAIDVPTEALHLELAPTVLDQELDTRQTTGVVYWEGSHNVQGTHAGQLVSGKSYVELTGYAPDH